MQSTRSEDSNIALQLSEENGATLLRMPRKQLFGWLTLDELTLAIPDQFTDSLAGQVATHYKPVRTYVLSANLLLAQEQINTYVDSLAPSMAAIGIDRLQLRSCLGHLELSARIRESTRFADLSARLQLSARGDRLRISCADARVYGYLETPAPVIAHRLLRNLFQVGTRGVTEELALGDFAIRPLASALTHCLPAAGWRLPNQRSLEIISVKHRATGLSVTLSPEEASSPNSHETATLLDSLERFRHNDTLMLEGRLEEALSGYRTELAARGNDDAFLVERILSIASASRAHFAEGLELARQSLGQQPDFAPAHAAIAAIHVAQAKVEKAASRYKKLCVDAQQAGNEEECVRSALACARLMRQYAAGDSTEFYELVLEFRPGHPEASEALASRYRDEQRWPDLIRLIRTRIAATTNANKKARDHSRLADILLVHLGDSLGAQRELLTARQLDDSIPLVYENLAEVEAARGELDEALANWEFANSLHKRRNNNRARVLNLVRGGLACQEAQELDMAEAWFLAALEIKPTNSAAMRGAASAAQDQGNHEEAVELWRKLVDADIESPYIQGYYAGQLAQSLYKSGQEQEALEYYEQALRQGGPRTKSETYSVLAEEQLASGNTAAAIEHYTSAIVLLRREESDSAYPQNDSHSDRKSLITEIALAKARANLSIGCNGDAIVDFELAFSTAEDNSISKREAADALLQRSAIGEGKLAWIEELLEGNTLPSEFNTYRIRSAAILMTQGKHEHALRAIESILRDTLDDDSKRQALAVKANIIGKIGQSLDRATILAERATLPGTPLQRADAALESAESWFLSGEFQRSISAAEAVIAALETHESDGATQIETLVQRERSYQCMAKAARHCRSWVTVDEAFAALQSLPGAQPLSSEQSLEWGEALEKLGQGEKAAELLSAIHSTHTNDSLVLRAHQALGRVYELLGKFSLAAEAEERYASSEAPGIDNESRAEAWYRAGALRVRIPDDVDNAKRCLDEALRCVGSHLPALDALEQIAKEEHDHERLAVILGRKIAPLRKHPHRQRSLLERLAKLQDQTLGRPDVAQQTYQRILDITPDYRPALTFMAEQAKQSGNVDEQYRLLMTLVTELPTDLQIANRSEEFAEQRQQAMYALANLVEQSPPADPGTCIATFTSALGEREDDRIWRGLQACYQQSNSLREVADVIGQRLSQVDEPEAATLALQRIKILADDLGDYTSALIALRIAQERHPDNTALAEWQRGTSGATIDVEAAAQTIPSQQAPSSEAQLYRALANEALERRQFREAYDNFESAIAIAPNATVIYEEYADAAISDGQFEVAATQLQALANLPESQSSAPVFLREQRGDLFLRLAELHYDKLAQPTLARQFMRRAADAFGGVRRATTLRQLATEAASAGAHQDAVLAYEAMGFDTLANHEVVSAAKLYRNLAQDHSAIDLLESQRTNNSLSDEGQTLLRSLFRDRRRNRELANSLVALADQSEHDIACTHLREALRIFRNLLADTEAATSTEVSLRELGHDAKEIAPSEEIKKLVEAAHDAAKSQRVVAVSLLTRAIEVDFQDPLVGPYTTGSQNLALLDTLRSLIRQPQLPEEDSATREVQAFAASLLLSAKHSEDSDKTLSLLREVAQLFRVELHDTRSAADVLFRALSMAPSQQDILAELVPILQESSDYALLVRTYELHLSALTGRDRTRPLRELGRVYEEVFREHSKAQACFDEAESNSTSSSPISPAAPSHYQITSNEIADELDKAAAQEGLGNIDDARAIFEAAAVTAPRDPRPFQALQRIYTAQRESTKLARVLEQLTTLSDNPKEKAALFYQRANLARTEFHDDVLVYEYLKEAAANNPDDLRYSHSLRTICMARGEWALAAELTYREISAQTDDEEKGALYLELALIFDEKLLDAPQAVVNFEQALKLDPSIRAAPRPLARLYELAGRHGDAFQMYQQAASTSPDTFESGRLLRHAAMNAEQAGLLAEARETYEKVAQSGSMQDAEAAVNAMTRIDGSEEDERGMQSGRTGYDSSSSDCISVDAMQARLQQNNFRDPMARAQLFYELACAYQFDLQDINAAVGAYEDALRADSEHVQAMDALADIAYQRRDWARAHSLYQQVPTTMSSLPPSVVAIRKGEVAELIGQEEAALEAFQVAQEFAPNNTEVLEGLVRCATRQGQYADALAAQSSLVQAIPIDQVQRLSTARLNEARLCERLENIEETITAYENILVEEIDSHAALSRLVPLYLKMNRFHDAAAALRSLIYVTPTPTDRAAYLFQLGEIESHSQDNPELAADSYFKAIDLDPGHVGTLRRLLNYYCGSGDFLSATEMARDLDQQFALLKAETGLPLLHRAAIAAALSGDTNLSESICESFGSGGVDELARALRQTYRIDNPPEPEKLARAVALISKATGDDLRELCNSVASGAVGDEKLYVEQLVAFMAKLAARPSQ